MIIALTANVREYGILARLETNLIRTEGESGANYLPADMSRACTERERRDNRTKIALERMYFIMETLLRASKLKDL